MNLRPDDIPVVPQEAIVQGQIKAVYKREGEYGPLIVLEVEEPGKAVVTQINFPFSSRPNSKWMTFVTSLNNLLPTPLTSAQQLVNRHVRIRMKLLDLELRSGEKRKIEQPLAEKLTSGNEKIEPDPEVMALIEENYAALSPEDFKAYVESLGYNYEEIIRVLTPFP